MQTRRNFNSSHGATLVEFALVAMLIAVITVAVIDLSRYLAIRSVVYRGALLALDQATKAPLLDTNPVTFTAATRTTFNNVRANIIAEAEQVGGTMVHSPSSADTTKFVSFSVPTGSGSVNSSYALLRPGDCFTASDGYQARHPTMACGADWGSSEAALQAHPFVIESRVRFKPLVPIIPPFTFSVKAAGYREVWVRGGGNRIESAPVVATPVPTATPPGGGSSGGHGPPSTPVPVPTPRPACSKSCGAHQVLVYSTCTCYCDVGYCPRGTANPGNCTIGCGG